MWQTISRLEIVFAIDESKFFSHADRKISTFVNTEGNIYFRNFFFLHYLKEISCCFWKHALSPPRTGTGEESLRVLKAKTGILPDIEEKLTGAKDTMPHDHKGHNLPIAYQFFFWSNSLVFNFFFQQSHKKTSNKKGPKRFSKLAFHPSWIDDETVTRSNGEGTFSTQFPGDMTVILSWTDKSKDGGETIKFYLNLQWQELGPFESPTQRSKTIKIGNPDVLPKKDVLFHCQSETLNYSRP